MELWKYGGEVLHVRLVQLFSGIWDQGKIPNEGKSALIIPIHKKADRRVCSNYRGISLLVTASKMYASILKMKFQQLIEDKIEEEQCGFRKSCSCIYAIFIII